MSKGSPTQAKVVDTQACLMDLQHLLLVETMAAVLMAEITIMVGAKALEATSMVDPATVALDRTKTIITSSVEDSKIPKSQSLLTKWLPHSMMTFNLASL